MKTQAQKTKETGLSRDERFAQEMKKQQITRAWKARDPRERMPRSVKRRPTDAEVREFIKKQGGVI